MNKFYITTSIAYVISAPHIGFSMELVQGDVLARFHRLKGEDVFYMTGTDEHGSKMAQTAEKLDMGVQELADKNAAEFEKLTQALNISNDYFIRTSSENHKRRAQALWQKLVDSGDIYKSTYEGYYCVGCESFILEKDLTDGVCPLHKTKPELLKEENYFFKLSRYSDKIGKLIESDELKVLPESRKNEILNVIKDQGLADVSFSRSKKFLKWGIPVPGDDAQIMYVWCDALSNYITGIGYSEDEEMFEKYWPADVHLIGKDIIRFHAGIWIGMLLSAQLPLPKSIYVHGFITSEGQKMSKSLGNTVDPFYYIETYGIDALRYYLLKEISTTSDGDFSAQRFKLLYNSDLANNLGNLLNRVITLSINNLGNNITAIKIKDEDKWKEYFDEIWREYEDGIANFDLKKSLETVMKVADKANLFVDQEKPWVLAKEGKFEEVKEILLTLLEILRQASIMLYPFLPVTSQKISLSLGTVFDKDFEKNREWGNRDFKLQKDGSLFPRVE